jgi:hypothetical protein
MREVGQAASSTIRRRLAALSSLYKHLVRHGHTTRNPVEAQARKLLGTRPSAWRAPPCPSPLGFLHDNRVYAWCDRAVATADR